MASQAAWNLSINTLHCSQLEPWFDYGVCQTHLGERIHADLRGAERSCSIASGFRPLDTCNHSYTQFPILSLFLNILSREAKSK